ncbi:MAG: hypothetical protein ACRDBM_12290, partial [Sporomusa sp.]
PPAVSPLDKEKLPILRMDKFQVIIIKYRKKSGIVLYWRYSAFCLVTLYQNSVNHYGGYLNTPERETEWLPCR